MEKLSLRVASLQEVLIKVAYDHMSMFIYKDEQIYTFMHVNICVCTIFPYKNIDVLCHSSGGEKMEQHLDPHLSITWTLL